jgi:phosphate uptake regulator
MVIKLPEEKKRKLSEDDEEEEDDVNDEVIKLDDEVDDTVASIPEEYLELFTSEEKKDITNLRRYT